MCYCANKLLNKMGKLKDSVWFKMGTVVDALKVKLIPTVWPRYKITNK